MLTLAHFPIESEVQDKKVDTAARSSMRLLKVATKSSTRPDKVRDSWFLQRNEVSAMGIGGDKHEEVPGSPGRSTDFALQPTWTCTMTSRLLLELRDVHALSWSWKAQRPYCRGGSSLLVDGCKEGELLFYERWWIKAEYQCSPQLRTPQQ
ncbi:hypothetical protein EIP91_008719 [Steccherinum ochraceum]|uniref:Uncharacterized protein n=1 Tax=Steccherinum ochraceum TaxID=92696 RepID=A0A4R0R2G3_9APHY|nr:hypothetical protein EIP91_008719 [Steccherinum ochraceum]